MSASEAEASERILLVDDNPTNLQVLFKTLDGRGYKLLIAKNGEDALSIAGKARPALILLDIMMPGINGFEVCEKLKAEPATRDCAIIFLSALDDTTNKVQGLELGAVDYIAKPFQAEEVIARVNTHLTIRRLQQSLARANEELEASNQRMMRALKAAARVQRALLPRKLPDTDAARFAWRYRPCDELGGDSLNIFPLDDAHVGLYVLDVSGQGIPAALFAATIARSLTPSGNLASVVAATNNTDESAMASPVEVAKRLNMLYPMDSKAMLNFTVTYGVLDTDTHRFRFASAGHPGPTLVRADQPPEIFEASGAPIGIMDDADYEETAIELRPGDRLYLHSDGLYEQRNSQGEQFGKERLQAVLDDAQSMTLEASIDTLLDEVTAWRGGAQLSDDVAIVAVEIPK